MFGIGVIFYNKNTNEWSRPYTYLYDKAIPKNTPVIVTNDAWYSVGKVVGFKENFKPLPNINYKRIISVLEVDNAV